jgi:hypothetical protein
MSQSDNVELGMWNVEWRVASLRLYMTTSQFLNAQKGERSKTAPLTQGSRKHSHLARYNY